jgi:aminoglycoside 6-adenylyltransferase
MSESGGNDATIQALIAWGEGLEAVRAMLLTSTRAVPGGVVDALSDYDVILVTRDIRPSMDDHGWIGDFGEVLIAYWDPVETDGDTGYERSGNIVQYADGLKIDFSLWPVGMLERIAAMDRLPDELDAGYRVLVDKDGVAGRLAAPTYRAYIPERPDEAAYLTLVNDFFVGVPYVAKSLARGDVLPGKWALDYDMRYVYLLPMLEWRVECDHGWSLPVGNNGKGLMTRLSPDTRDAMEGTYAGIDAEANCEAMFRMIELFRKVAREVGALLGYAYPEELDARVTTFAWTMLDGRQGQPGNM